MDTNKPVRFVPTDADILAIAELKKQNPFLQNAADVIRFAVHSAANNEKRSNELRANFSRPLNELGGDIPSL